MKKQKIIIATLRLVMGFIFLWAFIDKVFGLGFATAPEKSWIHGGSPTSGFLSFGVRGPFADIFHSLAGIAAIDWLFMLGLLLAGVTLLSGKFVKWGCLTGSFLLVLMYLSLLLPENNPFIDEHIVYILVLALVYVSAESKV